jgi:hypothetical protein
VTLDCVTEGTPALRARDRGSGLGVWSPGWPARAQQPTGGRAERATRNA